jgi:hypothetical protein
VGLLIADCQLPICDWRLADKVKYRKSRKPTRYPVVVLTSLRCRLTCRRGISRPL